MNGGWLYEARHSPDTKSNEKIQYRPLGMASTSLQ